jgi:Inner membrane protein YgaP-like, transmembrane domain
MTWQETFNRSRFSHFLNSPPGRIFRVVAGAAFLIVGLVFRHHPLGVLSMLWSVLPLTAGFFDVCYISAALGGHSLVRSYAVGTGRISAQICDG